jgi:DNA helicase II / ATP-dependent DNA helicase PcrA
MARIPSYSCWRTSGRPLDEKGKTTREPVDDPLLTAVRQKIRDAGEALRMNELPRLKAWDAHTCGSCDLVGLCRERPT